MELQAAKESKAAADESGGGSVADLILSGAAPRSRKPSRPAAGAAAKVVSAGELGAKSSSALQKALAAKQKAEAAAGPSATKLAAAAARTAPKAEPAPPAGIAKLPQRPGGAARPSAAGAAAAAADPYAAAKAAMAVSAALRLIESHLSCVLVRCVGWKRSWLI